MILSNEVYQCTAGETFDSIALELYGDEKYACELLNANPDLCMIPIFKGGEYLDIPVVEVSEQEDEEDEADETSAMPAAAPWKE